MKAMQEIKKFTAVVRLSHPHIISIWVGYGLSSAAAPFLTLYLSAIILNQLIARHYTSAFHTVLLLSGAVLIVSLLSKAFYNQLQVIQRTSIQRTDQKLLYKAMAMEFEQLEQ